MTNKKQKRGFTLIEIMVAMVVFSVFMGTMFSSYFSLINANKDADAVRNMYVGARDLFATLTEDIRLSAVDYYSMQGKQANGEELDLLSKDGLRRVVYKVSKSKDNPNFLIIKRGESVRDNLESTFAESQNEELVTAPDLLIKNFKFAISPQGDPYGKETFINVWSNQFQPQVTILANFVNKQEIGNEVEFSLQTTIASRVYTKVDKRDELSQKYQTDNNANSTQ